MILPNVGLGTNEGCSEPQNWVLNGVPRQVCVLEVPQGSIMSEGPLLAFSPHNPQRQGS